MQPKVAELHADGAHGGGHRIQPSTGGTKLSRDDYRGRKGHSDHQHSVAVGFEHIAAKLRARSHAPQVC